MDYGFMKSKKGAQDVEAEHRGSAPMLVMKERNSGMTMCMIVPAKGTAHAWVQRRCAKWIDSLGHLKVGLRCDNEPAIVALAREIRANRQEGSETVFEHPAVGESQENSVIEKAIDITEGLIRTLKDALEKRLGVAVGTTANVTKWLVEHSGYLYNRYAVGADGKTAMERWRGRGSKRPTCEFAEKLLYMPLKGARDGKFDVRFRYGVFLGMVAETGEFIIGTPDGAVRARSVRRLVESDRWDAALVLSTPGTPWAPAGGEVEQPLSVRIGGPQANPADAPQPPEFPTIARRTYIRKIDVVEHGYSQNCKGCAAIRANRPSQNHSEDCRARIQAAMSKTTAGQERLDKASRRMDEALSEQVEKRAKIAEGIVGGGDAGRPTAPSSGAAATASASASSSSARPAPATLSMGAPVAAVGTLTPTSSTAATGSASSSSAQPATATLSTGAPAATAGAPTQNPQPDTAPGALPDAQMRHSNLDDGDEDMDAEADDDRPKRQRLERVEEEPVSDGVPVRGRADVTEIYSPPRVTQYCEQYGLRPGGALDLTSRDESGEVWNFDIERKREQAKRLIAELRPRVIIGSPACTAFSVLQHMNRERMGEARFLEMKQRAIKHVEFCCELYEWQVSRGLYFVHEHPLSASSWKLPCVERVLGLQGVSRVTADMCAFNMTQTDSGGPGLVKKPTGFMTNSEVMASRLAQRCSGGHRHVALVGGRAAAAQRYPEQLCRTICEAAQAQMKQDEELYRATKDVTNAQRIRKIKKLVRKKNTNGEQIAIELNTAMHDEGECYWDDSKGGWIDPVLVRQARAEEMRYVRSHGVYERVSRQECWDVTGKAPVKTRWVDTDKGSAGKPNVRSRWVAQDFRREARPDLYAATPPLEAVKTLVSMAASGKGRGNVVSVMDVRRAYFYAPARRDVYVELPPEDYQRGDEDRCGKLKASLYGTRDAAQNWEEELCKQLCLLGFRRGRSSPCIYYHAKRGIAVVVHGDDILATGKEFEINWMQTEIEKVFQLRTQRIGGRRGLDRELTILNRRVRWTPQGYEIEADDRHVKEVLEGLGLERSNSVATPAVAQKKDGKGATGSEAEGEKLGRSQATKYRSLIARLNYLSQDRPDIKHAVMNLSSEMAEPSQGGWAGLTRLGRYLKGRPRVVALMPWQDEVKSVDAYADADWAGDRKTRKSVSGGCLMLGQHCVKFWSKRQQVVALSSAESELYSGLRAATEGLGEEALRADLGEVGKTSLHLDASAALALFSRAGLGRAKHVEIQNLWIQEAVKAGRIEPKKVDTSVNPADLLTKPLDAGRIADLMAIMGYVYRETAVS